MTSGLDKSLDFFTEKTKRIHGKWANRTESREALSGEALNRLGIETDNLRQTLVQLLRCLSDALSLPRRGPYSGTLNPLTPVMLLK